MATIKAQQQQSDLFTRLCASVLHLQCVKEYRFDAKRRWRYDYALPAVKIAIEVEGGVWTGGRHTRPKGFLNDIEKYNTGTLYGWRIFRTTPDALCSTRFVDFLKIAVAGGVGNAQTLL